MIRPGLTSITFRKRSAREVVELARRAGLDGIEWGGDVHAPPGKPALAREAAARTADAGLAVSSYGSYYRADRESGDFGPVLETARALGAPIARVWAGRAGSSHARPDYRREVAAALAACVDQAALANLRLGLEYHGNTLTDTRESAHRLLDEVGRAELRLYWQPRNKGSFEADQAELQAALPRLAHLHVFHWIATPEGRRRPLEEGDEAWRARLKLALQAPGDRFALLEFVRDDDPRQFLEDAAALQRLLQEAQSGRTAD